MHLDPAELLHNQARHKSYRQGEPGVDQGIPHGKSFGIGFVPRLRITQSIGKGLVPRIKNGVVSHQPGGYQHRYGRGQKPHQPVKEPAVRVFPQIIEEEPEKQGQPNEKKPQPEIPPEIKQGGENLKVVGIVTPKRDSYIAANNSFIDQCLLDFNGKSRQMPLFRHRPVSIGDGVGEVIQTESVGNVGSDGLLIFRSGLTDPSGNPGCQGE